MTDAAFTMQLSYSLTIDGKIQRRADETAITVPLTVVAVPELHSPPRGCSGTCPTNWRRVPPTPIGPPDRRRRWSVNPLGFRRSETQVAKYGH